GSGTRGALSFRPAAPRLPAPRVTAGRDRVRLALEVAEDRSRIDPEIARRLGPVPVVPLEDLEHVAALEVLFRLLEREDRRFARGAELEIVHVEELSFAQDERFLEAVLELADVP